MKTQHPHQALSRLRPVLLTAFGLIAAVLLSAGRAHGVPGEGWMPGMTAHTNQDRIDKRKRLSLPPVLWWTHTNQDQFDPPGDPPSAPDGGSAPDDPPFLVITGDPQLAAHASLERIGAWTSDMPARSARPATVMGVPGPGALLPGLALLLLRPRRRRSDRATT